MPERRPRVLLADDHPLMLEALAKLLEPDFDVTGTVSDGRALVATAEAQRPDLVITDVSMPEIDGIDVTRRLRASVPETRILIFTIHTERSWAQAAFEAGAHGYLAKCCAPGEIDVAVREVLRGHVYVCPVVASRLILGTKGSSPTAAGASKPETLTQRELDIVRLVGKGLGNKEIARELGVAVTTVRSHLSNVYDKLGPGSRVGLALYAASSGEQMM